MPPLDVLVWGATGYSGRLIARYLASRGTPGLRWGVGGRNDTKLDRLIADLPPSATPSPAKVVGDAADPASVGAAVAQARVVIAAAGPFSAVGDVVVDQCVRQRRHYVDINGETPWVRGVIDRCHAEAAAAGVTIVPNAGFDAVPFDMGALHAALAVQQRHGAPARAVRCYVDMRGGLSGGTVATGMLMEELGFANLKKMANPYLLGGAPPTPRPEDRDVRTVAYSDEAGAWTGPFLMSVINTRVVRRSMELLASGVYAPHASYTERAVAADEAAAKRLLAKAPLAERKKQVERGALPAPGEGPSDADNARASFTADFYAEPEGGGCVVHTRVSGGGPYVETARAASEAALLLAGDAPRMPGVLTPAAALGEPYIHALDAAGMKFEVVSA